VSEDDDRAWLDALAGRTGETPARAIEQEGLALREQIRALERAAAAGDGLAEIDAARENELIARAVAEGLLAPRAVRTRRTAGLRLGMAAAAVILVAVAVSLLRSMQPPTETFRGAQNGTIRLEARDPSALKRQLIDELSAAGVEVAGYERLGRLGIDADLPQPVPAQVRQVLERHHIPVPADGALIVEIDAPGQP
jgi:hypothetical protein